MAVVAGCMDWRCDVLKEIDIPPLWLGLALLVGWGLGKVWAVPGFGWLGAGLVLLGLAMMAAAVVQMVAARTSFIPRRNPSALVTGGIFRICRNPIYLGDILVLSGAILLWGAVLALPLVPLFGLWITRRYILDEEARLRRTFGATYETWAARVPRWVWRI